MTEFLTRDELTRPLQRRFREFDVKYNGSVKRVRIRSLSERERSKFELASLNNKGEWKQDAAIAMKSALISLCVVGEDNEPLLREGDVKALSEQDGMLTGAIYDECVEHCGLRDTSAELLAKNFGAGGEEATPDD